VCVIGELGSKGWRTGALLTEQILQLAVIKPDGETAGLYLVKGSFDSENCIRIDIEKPLPQLEHEVVGQLMDVDVEPLVSAGNVVAVSSSRRRIAVATWRRVQIFSIEAEAFLEASVGSLKMKKGKTKRIKRTSAQYANLSCEFSDDGDHTYSRNCGQGFYHEYTQLFGRQIVAIHGVQVRQSGVVHKLHFVDDETLWGWTDVGLAKWYWGQGRSGKRTDRELCVLAAKQPTWEEDMELT